VPGDDEADGFHGSPSANRGFRGRQPAGRFVGPDPTDCGAKPGWAQSVPFL